MRFDAFFFFFSFQLNDHLQEVEEEAMTKTVELEKQLSEANTELEQLKV